MHLAEPGIDEALGVRLGRFVLAVHDEHLLAAIDEMTGLRNRRGVNIIINDELGRMKRAQLPVSLIVLDVDHFKTYNDNYGHPAGDQVLQRIATVMLEMTKLICF